MEQDLPEIKILTDDVANKIAAGEVIERPAAAVKELVENSIDARATSIGIEFKNGGKSFIKVSDNGHGMRRDQLLTCLEPHATSKIRTADDLDSILSFGFRGEALPSIASVSKFAISSKPEGAKVGNRVDVRAGVFGQVREIAMSRGTEITVEDLFCSVPARRKFLKSDNTEASHIIKMCKLYALAKPEISFSLREDSRQVFASKPTSDLISRIKNIFGDEISSKLVPLKSYTGFGLSVSGAVSKPAEFWPTSKNIFAFINGRPVECRAVFSALKEAYKSAMPQGKYPAAFLFIEIDPRFVDVNVHPAKREVRLKNEFAFRAAILAAVADTIENYSIGAESGQGAGAEIPPPAKTFPQVPKTFAPPRDFQESEKLREIIDFSKKNSAPAQSDFIPAAPARREIPDPAKEAAKLAAEEFAAPKKARDFDFDEISPAAKIAAPPKAEDLRPSSTLGWKYLKHLSKKYALFETQSGSLVILSISSALKRINYEKILSNFGGEKPKSQTLLIPVNIEFDRADDEVFRRNLRGFNVCGFEIEEFGERFYRVGAIPLWLDFSDVESFIKDFVELAREEGFEIGRKNLSEQTFARLAVKMSRGVKIVESEFAANSLLDDLFMSKSPMFSPDGRRTCKEITAAEIRAFFGE
ncbi:MAG: DNA mismatch repair endonuclease MutL [Opitutales bacterium]|nr:DNA mismatch repair endonuclease MutL [Opitutales bacterium]